MFFAPFPEEEISDYLAQGSFIRALTVGLGAKTPFPSPYYCAPVIAGISSRRNLKLLGIFYLFSSNFSLSFSSPGGMGVC